jgi:hypothetical protein
MARNLPINNVLTKAFIANIGLRSGVWICGNENWYYLFDHVLVSSLVSRASAVVERSERLQENLKIPVRRVNNFSRNTRETGDLSAF